MCGADWGKLGDLVADILTKMYLEKRPLFEAQAARLGVALECLAAAAITAALAQRLEASLPQPRPVRKRR